MPIPSIRPEDLRAPTGGIVRGTRRPPGWVAPGPRPPFADAVPGGANTVPDALWPTADEDLCWLAGDFRILQRLDGHRWSLDDLMTAWLAARALPEARRVIDLGCGIGTVLLFLSWRFPAARLLGVEAQPESAALARRSIAWNDVGDRVSVIGGDLRDEAIAPTEKFELVTGTPPYFPPGTGIESERPQCAPCRFEHRGGVEDYIVAVARLLAPGGRAVICQGSTQTHRVPPSVEAAGLVIEEQVDVVPRTGKPVLLSLYTLCWPADAKRKGTSSIVVRQRDGQWTDDFRAVRRELGMPPGRTDG